MLTKVSSSSSKTLTAFELKVLNKRYLTTTMDTKFLKISHLPTSSEQVRAKPLFKLHAFLIFNSRTYFLLRDYLRISTGYAAQKELNDLTESFNSQQVFFLITVQTTTCHLFFAKRRF